LFTISSFKRYENIHKILNKNRMQLFADLINQYFIHNENISNVESETFYYFVKILSWIHLEKQQNHREQSSCTFAILVFFRAGSHPLFSVRGSLRVVLETWLDKNIYNLYPKYVYLVILRIKSTLRRNQTNETIMTQRKFYWLDILSEKFMNCEWELIWARHFNRQLLKAICCPALNGTSTLTLLWTASDLAHFLHSVFLPMINILKGFADMQVDRNRCLVASFGTKPTLHMYK